MNDRFKNAFDEVKASAALKRKTEETVVSFMRAKSSKQASGMVRPAVVGALLFCLIFGGYSLFFVSTATIAIDINPSLELKLNRFDTVVRAEGVNEDGAALVKELSLQFTSFENAILQITRAAQIMELSEQEEGLTITVAGTNQRQTGRLLADARKCTSGIAGAACYRANSEEWKAAREMNLPMGKYRLFLEWKQRDPTVTSEQLRNMSMREIRDALNRMMPENSFPADDHESFSDNSSEEENQAGHRNRKRNQGW